MGKQKLGLGRVGGEGELELGGSGGKIPFPSVGNGRRSRVSAFQHTSGRREGGREEGRERSLGEAQ